MKGKFMIGVNLFFYFVLSAQNIKINEVFYDPVGADSGYEWIELYNPNEQNVNLEGWVLQKAGSDWSTVYIFGTTIIPAFGYLLLGENMVSNCDIYLDLAFQNGGSSTDAIRIISPENYTDTILYDEPNDNNLPSDINDPAIYFAIDVSSGCSLARYHDGEDTDNCEIDWFEAANPTPKEENYFPIDLAITTFEFVETADNYTLSTVIYNLSTQPVDNYVANLQITLNNNELYNNFIPSIAAEDSIKIVLELGELDSGYYVAESVVNLLIDNELENNSMTASVLVGIAPIIINEILYKDSEYTCEWIELFNRSECAYYVDNFVIKDRSGGEITFSGKIYPQSYLVISQQSEILNTIYPKINPEMVVKAIDWTSLNNSNESLYLMDEYNTIFDSISYLGPETEIDVSLERKNPFSDENIQWSSSISEFGATPTLVNSILPLEYDLRLDLQEWDFSSNQLIHNLKITNQGLFDLNEGILKIFYNDELELEEELFFTDSLNVEIITEAPYNGYYTLKYEILNSKDLNISNNVQYSFYNDNTLPFVINEIMYNPFDEEPEWIEIKSNQEIENLDYLQLVIDEDTLVVPYLKEEYLVLVNSFEDSLFMQEKYAIEPIVCGLSSLSNNGEYLELSDVFGNNVENFNYLPEWNFNSKGVSIERINPLISSNERNWTSSVQQSTPGRENSVYTSYEPKTKKLAISPNPFSPYQNENTIIAFKLPDTISRCTIRIYDLDGRLRRKLVDQELYASSNEIIYDGKDAEGKYLLPGIYVMLLEAVTHNSGKIVRLQDTIVIAK